MGTLGFYFFNHFIAYYGLMIVIGIAVAAFIAHFQIKKFHLSWNDFLIICATSGLFCIIGAKILYLLLSIHTLELNRLKDLSYINTLMSGGFVFFGGLIGIFPALYLCQKKLGIPVSEYLQYCTCCIPIAHGFGRIGCYLVGCCHGIPYDGRFSVIYSHSLYAPNGVRLFPVQLLEAFGEFIIGLFLLYSCRKQKKVSPIIIYVISYCVLRFFLEYLRGDSIRGSLYGFSTSQLISIPIIIGLSIILHKKRRI
ncbi:MAG: prolipoprotein diacylglyceryl transferase [Lachnospiraceae bacterium]|nr:prolipoprotein diacylglyceryl transferase [Lachnospiraceae bacterium]